MDIRKIPKDMIVDMFRRDMELSIEYNDEPKNRILGYRQQFYADNKQPVRIDKGSWFSFNLFSQLDMSTESMRDSMSPEKIPTKEKKSPFGNYSNVEWKLTRKLGEPLIANVAKPLIEATDNIAIESKGSRNQIRTRVTEKILNHFNDSGANRNAFFKRFARNAVVDGTAFGRVGYEMNNNEYKIEIEKSLYDKLKKKYEKNSDRVNVKKIGKKYFFIDDTNVENELTRDAIDPICVQFDPLNPAMEKKRFFVVMENVTVADCISRYGEDVKNDLVKIAKDSFGYEQEKDINRKMVTLYEYWTKLDLSDEVNPIKNRMSRVILATPYYKDNAFECEIDKTQIIDIRESPYVFNRIPFFRAFGFDGSNEDWGDGVAEFTKDLQSVQKKLINGILDNVSNGILNKWFIEKGLLDPTNKDNLEANKPVIEFNRRSGNIKDKMYQASFNSIPSSVYSLFEVFSQQSEELTGVNKTMTGTMGANLNSSSSNFSAGLSLAQTRVAMVISNIKDALIDSNKMWTDISVILFEEDEIKKITGIDVQAEMVKFAKEKLDILLGGIEIDAKDTEELVKAIIKEEWADYRDISSKFDINIKIASEASQEIKSAKIITLIQQARELGKTLPADTINDFVAELADAQGFGHIVNKIRNYKQQPDPIAQQLAELEVAEKAANVDNVKAETEKNKALAKNAVSRSAAVDAKATEQTARTGVNIDSGVLDNQQKELEIAQKDQELSANKQIEGEANGFDLYDEI